MRNSEKNISKQVAEIQQLFSRLRNQSSVICMRKFNHQRSTNR